MICHTWSISSFGESLIIDVFERGIDSEELGNTLKEVNTAPKLIVIAKAFLLKPLLQRFEAGRYLIIFIRKYEYGVETGRDLTIWVEALCKCIL